MNARRALLVLGLIITNRAIGQVDLRLGATVSATCVSPGSSVTYRISVGAPSGSTATGVVLRQRLGPGSTFLSGDAGCSACAEFVTCSLGRVQSWPRQVNVSVQVGSALGTALSSMSVRATQVDPDTSNNLYGPVSVEVRSGGSCLLVEGVNPGSMPSSGGLGIEVLGQAFATGAALRIGGFLVGGATVVDSGRIVATAPGLPPGTYDVSVTNPGGEVGTLFNGYHAYQVPAMKLFPLAPCRALDTRDAGGPSGGAPLGAGETRAYALTGRCALPSTARAIARNVTVVSPAAAGSLAMGPGDLPLSAASAVSFKAGRTIANNGIDLLATDGSGRLAIRNDSAASVHVLVDVSGYFE